MPAREPRVELLWWEGCPSTPRALEDLRAAMTEVGLDPGALEVRRIESEAQSVAEGFVGSPTIRIDGRDPQPPVEDRPALACRLYRLRDGRPSPTPDPEDLRDALLAAVGGGG